MNPELPVAHDHSYDDRKNVFLVGLTPFHREKLESIQGSERLRFHGLLDEPHGYDADVTLLDGDLTPRQTFVGGRRVYSWAG